MMLTTRLRTGWTAAATALCTGLLLAGCESLPTRAPAAPELQLQSAEVLSLPPGCDAAGGAVYRTRYVVRADGRVTGVASESGSGCVQDTLRQWVESFRYAPLADPFPTTIDWMAVTAQRGG
jgi:hypothetical protein